jgi:TM2 domain-containing membrane protein YozV
MDSKDVNQCIMMIGDKIPNYCLPSLRQMLERSHLQVQDFASMIMVLKDPTIAIILSVLVGTFGVDRFYIGNIGMGVGKLLTCGGLYVWWIVDIFLIMGATRERNWLLVMSSLS